ncbi:Uncharacterized protein OBRU01_21809, partial [Operophtera brumata]
MHKRKVKIGRKFVNIKAWITPGLIKCMRHRDKLHKDCRDFPDDIERHKIYKRYRIFCNNLLFKIKSQYNREQNEINDPKKLRKSIKRVCQNSCRNSDSSKLLKACHGSLTSHNFCNQYFVTVGKKLADNILNKLSGTQESLISSYRPKRSVAQSLFNIKAWITPGLIRCMRHRDKLHKDCRDFPDDIERHKIYKRVFDKFIQAKKNLLTLYVKKTHFLAFSKTSVSCPPQDLVIKLHTCSRDPQRVNGICPCSLISRTPTKKYL